MPGWAFAILVIVCVAAVGILRQRPHAGDLGSAVGEVMVWLGWGVFVLVGTLVVLSVQGFIGWN